MEANQRPLASLPSVPEDLVARWALTRLDIVSTGRIQADFAYRDYCEWCSAQRVADLTPQMFGRRFTKMHAGMGGRKVKRRGRAYYEGAALQSQLNSPTRKLESWRLCALPANGTVRPAQLLLSK
jgi:hypothetical protein